MEKDTITKTKDQSLEIPIIPKEENSYITPRINDPIALKRVEEMNSFIDYQGIRVLRTVWVWPNILISMPD